MPPRPASLLRLKLALSGRSTKELRDRARQVAFALRERAGFSADCAPPTEVDWQAECPGLPDRVAALSWFRNRRAEGFLAGAVDLPATIGCIVKSDSGTHERVVADATSILAGRYPLLGHRRLDYGPEPDWQRDGVSGRRAPIRHWSVIPYLDESVVGDHKVTWELNRHQWLLTLARAYLLTGDERWARAAFDRLDSWITANPPKLGINWVSSLEIAFRSIAWLWTLQLLRHSPSLTPERFTRLIRVLAIGGRHVEDHLSTWFSPNTHLTGEALGLLYLGCALPALKDAARWRERSIAILAEWMPRHVRGDGSYIEQSTHYARYTLDFLNHAVLLCRANGLEPPGSLVESLERLSRFLRHLTRPDGTLPLLGDDDGGRLIFLDSRLPDDIRPTLAVAEAVLGRRDAAWPKGEVTEEMLWLLGPQVAESPVHSIAEATDGASRDFAKGGFTSLRDGWNREASFAVLDSGPHGMGNGGHAHADLGSFELCLEGRSVVVDPGTYSYMMASGRDDFRGATAHAVPLVDGTGSADPAGPFAWRRSPCVLGRTVKLGAAFDAVAFTHDGFFHLEDPVAYRRALVRVRRDYWLLMDTFRSRGSHEVTLGFPLAPELEARIGGAGVDVVEAERTVARFLAEPDSAWSVAETAISRIYGSKLHSRRLQRRIAITDEILIVTLIHGQVDSGNLSLIMLNADGERCLVIEGGCDVRDTFRVDDVGLRMTDREGQGVAFSWPALELPTNEELD